MEMCQNLRIHLNTSAETSKSRLDALAPFLGLYRWLSLFKWCPRSTSYYSKIILYSRPYGNEARRGWVNIVMYFSHQKMWRSGLCVGVITWNVKRFATFHLGSFLEYGLSFQLMYFFFSFWSLHLIWKYFLVGPSPTMSNFIVNAHLQDFQSVVLCTGKL